MKEGKIVETLDAEAMRDNAPADPYTRDLLVAGQGYAAAPEND